MGEAEGTPGEREDWRRRKESRREGERRPEQARILDNKEREGWRER